MISFLHLNLVLLGICLFNFLVIQGALVYVPKKNAILKLLDKVSILLATTTFIALVLSGGMYSMFILSQNTTVVKINSSESYDIKECNIVIEANSKGKSTVSQSFFLDDSVTDNDIIDFFEAYENRGFYFVISYKFNDVYSKSLMVNGENLSDKEIREKKLEMVNQWRQIVSVSDTIEIRSVRKAESSFPYVTWKDTEYKIY